MKVIGHQNVPPHEPCLGITPYSLQEQMGLIAGEPRQSVFGAYGQVNDRGAGIGDFYTVGWVVALFVVGWVNHGEIVANRERV